MSKELIGKFADAFTLIALANDAMITAIQSAVIENCENRVEYSHTDDSGCVETRLIGGNENGEYCIFDEDGNELVQLDDLTANELYEICINLV